MNSHVILQFCWLRKLLSASFAETILLSGVYGDVGSAGPFVAEFFAAVRATVRFHAGMQPDVSAQIRFLREQFRTVRALMFGPHVNQQMLLKRISALQKILHLILRHAAKQK